MSKKNYYTISSEGRDRLIWAILNNALRDWDKYSRRLWSKSNRLLAIYELKQIINFIMSDWYVYLTNGNSSQEDIVQGLLKRITHEKSKKELTAYAKSKSTKPFIFQNEIEFNQISE